MITRIAKALEARKMRREDNEQGFTLIELLVVVLIIGILSAIAIPIFLSTQSSARDSSAQSDVTNAKVALVAYIAGHPTDAIPTAVGTLSADFTPTADSVITITLTADGKSFCIAGWNKTNAGADGTTANSKKFGASSSSGTVEGTCASGVFTPKASASPASS